METSSLKRTQIQKQLKTLLFVLFFVSAVNALFLWKTLDNLFESYNAVAKGQKLSSLVGSLGQQLYEESLLRDATSVGTEESRAQRLGELRSEIKSNFKEALEISGNDKKKSARIKGIQNEWQLAKNFYANAQVLILVNSFLKEEQKALMPLDKNVSKSKQAAIAFIAFYMVLIASALLILSQYLKQRIFSPLTRLTDEMQNFEATQSALIPKTFKNDEIGLLESKFHEMASRISNTVDSLKELDKIKTDFLSLASHELRTPMTSVKGALSLILSSGLEKFDQDTKELLQVSEKESDRLIRLINDILDLTKIEARKMPLNKKWINASDLIKTSVEAMHGFLNITGVSIEVAKNEIPCEVYGDKDKLQQVITNLLSNAIKFSPKGESVEIGYVVNNSNLSIYVADHGPGIKFEDQSYVFEKFRSIDASKSKVIKGTGLGLPICKALVEQHGGKIGLQSEIGVGSTFYFTLNEFRIVSHSKNSEAA
ncbi:MAG: hypothetical protein IPM57_08040 [Oligoflexia bacterium]|nr:hypothetical protein [Oligoflexia bacterium]